MNFPSVQKLNGKSPFWFVSFWSVLLLGGFLPLLPQPENIVGYLWKVEFLLAGFLFVALFFAVKQARKTGLQSCAFSRDEFYLIVLPIIILTIWSGLSIIWAESWRGALHHTLLWACYTIFYILSRQTAGSSYLLSFSSRAAVFIAFIIGSACLVEFIANPDGQVHLFTTRYYKYAEALAVLLPLFIVLYLRSKNRLSIFYAGGALVGWLVILLCLSRTVFIAALAGLAGLLILVLFYRYKLLFSKKLLLICGLLLISFLALNISFSKADGTAVSDKSVVKRLASDADARSNLEWRYLTWGITYELFRENPVFGVGADNFFNLYKPARREFSARHPENNLLDVGETILPERSHNEFLQMAAELGIVGILIFGWLLLGIAYLFVRRFRQPQSLVTLASLAGLAAFLVSSLASSYSFRVPANGLCFFFVLALAINGLTKERKEAESAVQTIPFSPGFAQIGLAICVLMLIFSAVRGASLMFLKFAFATEDKALAESNYQKALALDNQEGYLHLAYGMFLSSEKRFPESATEIRSGIDRGIATPVTYFSLYGAQTFAESKDEAERTLREGLQIYPRSVFLRTAYAALLKENGKISEAETELAKAERINSVQAASWWFAHTQGLDKITAAATNDPNLVEAMELKPAAAIYALLDFQRQKNPELFRFRF